MPWWIISQRSRMVLRSAHKSKYSYIVFQLRTFNNKGTRVDTTQDDNRRESQASDAKGEACGVVLWWIVKVGDDAFRHLECGRVQDLCLHRRRQVWKIAQQVGHDW
jgi:hypothetical protein